MHISFSALGRNVMFVVSAIGQQRPNFSGTWEENSNRYREDIEKVVHQDASLTIETTIREKPGPPSAIQRPTAVVPSGPVSCDIEVPEQTGTNEKAQTWCSVNWQDSILVMQLVQKEGHRVTNHPRHV